MRHVSLVLALALLWLPSSAAAEQGRAPQPGNDLPPQFKQPADFFFGPPKASLGFRGGLTFAKAGSDWYDFVTTELTLDKRDFRTASIGGELVVMLPIKLPLELVLAGEYGGTTQESEFRYWVDNDRLPIQQVTRLRQSTLTAGLRYPFLGRGNSISSLAWVPRKFAPYAGGGVGGLWYRMQQDGDFVDFRTLAVFSDILESTGWAFAPYVNGGIDVHMTRQLFVNADVRYLWAHKPLKQPWLQFDPLDLAGLRLATGINVLF